MVTFPARLFGYFRFFRMLVFGSFNLRVPFAIIILFHTSQIIFILFRLVISRILFRLIVTSFDCRFSKCMRNSIRSETKMWGHPLDITTIINMGVCVFINWVWCIHIASMIHGKIN